MLNNATYSNLLPKFGVRVFEMCFEDLCFEDGNAVTVMRRAILEPLLPVNYQRRDNRAKQSSSFLVTPIYENHTRTTTTLAL